MKPLAFDSPGVSYRVSKNETSVTIEMIYNNAVCGSFKMPKSEAIKVAKEINPSDIWIVPPGSIKSLTENDGWKEVELWGGDFDEKQDAELERKHHE